MDGMCKIEKWLMFVLCLLVACSTFGQVVPVEMAVSFSRADAVAPAPANATVSDTGDVWIFVLDHSGSMADEDAIVHVQGRWSSGERKTSRWNALLDSFRTTLSHIEPGAIVQVVRVSDEKAELIRFGAQNAMVISGDRERNTIYKTVEQWGKPAWRTPLWHGLFLASQEAKRFISTENRNVGIIVFSDGKDESENGFSKDSLKPFQEFFNQDEFTACLTWINSKSPDLPELPFGPKFLWAKPPQSGNVVPVVCRVRPEVPFVSVRNPLSGEGRTVIPVGYSFPLSEEKWNALLETGFEANLQLVSRDGQVVGGEAVPVGTSRERVVFRVPESSFQGQTGSEFSLRLDLPQTVQGCRFVSPRPVRLAFEKQGSVMISEVAPRSGVMAKVGETVQFSAQGTSGAEYSWSFGDGEKAQGQRVSHAFAAAAPKGISFSVTAEKAGLAPTTSSGTIVVLDAGVSMDAIPGDIKVGSPTDFSCRGKGEVHSYEWFIDGAPVAGGKDAPDGASSKLAFTFKTAGRHTVRVRANMKRVSPEETQDIPFQVAEAPYAAVVKPEANDVCAGGDLVEFEARVEGTFSSGIWQVMDESGVPVGDAIASPVAGKAARAKFAVPEAGGRYTVVFRAGEGSEAVQSDPVAFSAKPKDVRIDVVAPIRDAVVKTDAQTELRAMTKGVSGAIGFFLLEDGKETALGSPVKVAGDGTAALAWMFPAKDGQGDRLLVARSEDGRIESDPLSFVLETEAGLVLEKPACNASVTYGGALDFEAAVSGVIDSRSVQWFLRPVGGEEQLLPDGIGKKISHVFEAVENRKGVAYEVYARAKLPDGTSIETDYVTVRALCPEIIAKLDVPKDVSPCEEFTVRLEMDAQSAPVKTVEWNFGDGTILSTSAPDLVKHSFREEGTKTVSVKALCETCREEKIFDKQVAVTCPPLSPVKLFVESEVEIGQTVNFQVQHTGKASEYRWDFGDGESVTNREPNIAHSYGTAGTYVASVSPICALCGRADSSSPATIAVKCPALRPMLHFAEREGVQRFSFGLREEVGMELRVASGREGDVRNVRWEFGDGSAPEESGTRLFTSHRYDNYASNIQVRAVVACARCGEECETSGILAIEIQPPKAAFEIVPERDRYSVNGTIELLDMSEGDVDRCIWFANGEPFVTSAKGEKVTFDCPSHPTDVRIGLAVENDVLREMQDSRWTDLAQERKLRFRWGLLTALLFVAAGGVLWFVLLHVLSNNALRDCSSYSWVDPQQPAPVGNQLPAHRYQNLGHLLHFRDFWFLLSYLYRPKHVDIPLGNLPKQAKQGTTGWSAVMLRSTFTFGMRHGRVYLMRYPSDFFHRRTRYEGVLNPPNGSVVYFVFEERYEPHRWLYIAVVRPPRSKTALWCSVLLVLGTLSLLGGVLWAVASFSL